MVSWRDPSEEDRPRRMNELLALVGRLPSELYPDLEKGLSKVELTLLQFSVLAFLSEGPKTAGEVVVYLHMGHSPAADLLVDLERRGLVERIYTVGAEGWYRLAPLGRQRLDMVSRTLRIWKAQQLAEQLSSEELAAAVHALRTILRILDRRQDGPGGSRSA